MPDYDAIVIGAGHNGLTAAVVMARGGMRVLCLEKNHFIGGMATTTELARGYRFELAGSIQFPVPSEIYDDLGFDACPIYEPEVQSAAIGPSGEPPLLLHSDPDKLFEHLNERMGLEAVLGMAEIAAWADAPARAIGRFDVRTPPKSLDEMFACATNETERQAIRTAMFGSVMDVVDRHLPDPVRHAQVRSMLAFLSVNSTFRGPYSEGSALCLAFALASPTGATMSKVKGGIGTLSAHLAQQFEQHGGELRRHVKVAGIATEAGRVVGVRLGDGETVSAPVVVSNLDPTATFTQLLDRDDLPDDFLQRVDAIDHRALYFQMHFALDGLPEWAAPYEELNDGELSHNVTFFGTPRRCRPTSRAASAAWCPPSPRSTCRSRRSGTPTWPHRASTWPAASPSTPHRRRPRRPGPAARRDGGPDAGQAHPPGAELPRPGRAAVQLPRLHLRADVRLHRGRLLPRAAAARVHGAVPARAPGLARRPVPVDGLYLCGAGCHGGPGITFIPGYNCGYEVLDGPPTGSA